MTQQTDHIGDSKKKMTAVEWLAEKYNYVTWLRIRDEISPEVADNLRERYLTQAKQIEKEQMYEYIERLYVNGDASYEYHKKQFEQYYNETYGKK